MDSYPAFTTGTLRSAWTVVVGVDDLEVGSHGVQRFTKECSQLTLQPKACVGPGRE